MRLDRIITLNLMRPLLGGGESRATDAVPILMYHSISDDPEPTRGDYYKTCTSPARFRENMQILQDEGFVTTDLASVLNGGDREGEIAPSRRVVITFDDGFDDFCIEAWPVLQEFGFAATMFLPTDFIGDERREFLGLPCMTWSDVRDMKEQGVSFGSHTQSHPKLIELDQELLVAELTESRQVIQSQLGDTIDTFAHPYAFPATNRRYVDRFRNAARNAGYKACVTTAIGRFRSTDDPLTIKRLPVNNADDADLFRAKILGHYDWLAKPQRVIKKLKPMLKLRR